MRTFAFLGILLSCTLSWASETKSLLPIGAISAGSTITTRAAKSTTSYVTPTSTSEGSTLENVNSGELVEVTSIKSKTNTADGATLQALAGVGSLLVQKNQLNEKAVSCSTTNGIMSCSLKSDLSAMKAGSFDMSAYVKAMMQTNMWKGGKSSAPAKPSIEKKEVVTEEPKTEKQKMDEAYAEAAVETIEAANKKLNPLKTEQNCDETNFPEDIRNNKDLSCGLKQALEAFKKNKSQIKNEVFIFNDFSSGGVMGKMYFLNADGSPAKLLDKNPISTSRGEGGFGPGRGSLKTPNGAILTKAYRPPRAGNIRDGIELVGLESENKDIHSRGILLHGWDPYMPTEGCLGVAGALDTRTQGQRNLGGTAYLDILKKDLLKDGGVMIYNYTPAKAQLCK